MWLKLFCLVLLGVSLAGAVPSRDRNNKPYKVVCYLGSWANYRRGEGKFLIEHIDPYICTHLVYGFAKLGRDNRIAAYDPYLDLKENWGLGAFKRFNNLKNINPYLTTILAIGGWNEGSVKYSKMANDSSTRAIFVQSCVDFLLKYNFDGLDMDWEYPANRGGEPEDKENFIALLRELKAAFQKHGLLLTAAVSAGQHTIDKAYDIAAMGRHLDIINLMAYDFHGSWENVTGHNAPLYARPEETEEQKILNVDYAVKLWIKRGAPSKKIVLGMATYGRSFTLRKAEDNGLDEPVSGKGAAGSMTREPGMLGYNEICLNLQRGWKTVWVPHHEAPYAYNDRQWVGYDDLRSIGIKVEYLKKMNLGGGMIWSIETDDFRGKCSPQKYPIITLIQTKLNGPIQRVTLPPHLRTTTPVPEGTPVTKDWTYYQCFDEGFFRHPRDCTKFVHCIETGKNSFKFKIYQCGGGNVFDEKKKMCNKRELVPGC